MKRNYHSHNKHIDRSYDVYRTKEKCKSYYMILDLSYLSYLSLLESNLSAALSPYNYGLHDQY